MRLHDIITFIYMFERNNNINSFYFEEEYEIETEDIVNIINSQLDGKFTKVEANELKYVYKNRIFYIKKELISINYYMWKISTNNI